MDSGCAVICSPYIEDFIELKPLKQPIVLKRVTGEQHCTYGGLTNIQYIDNKNNIQILVTPVFYNLYQTVRFFSPQTYFIFTDKKIKKVTYTYSGQKFIYVSKIVLSYQLLLTPLLLCLY